MLNYIWKLKHALVHYRNCQQGPKGPDNTNHISLKSSNPVVFRSISSLVSIPISLTKFGEYRLLQKKVSTQDYCLVIKYDTSFLKRTRQ